MYGDERKSSARSDADMHTMVIISRSGHEFGLVLVQSIIDALDRGDCLAFLVARSQVLAVCGHGDFVSGFGARASLMYELTASIFQQSSVV